MNAKTEFSRRSALKLIGGVGASFALGSFACGSPGAGLPVTAGASDKGAAFVPNAFLKIDPDGTITVTVSKSDMGQGVRTAFAMLVAEELDADWSTVRVVQAPANSMYGDQGTGGSSSIRDMHDQLRRVGAGARAMLVAAAAKEWGVDPATCTTANGKVLHAATGKATSYASLTTQAAAMTVPTDVKLKDQATYKIVGNPVSRIDNKAVATGKAIYGLDVRVEGMLYSVIARTPAFGASINSVDDSAARQVPDVVDVVRVSSGVAVVAKNTWAAMKGCKALKIDWNPGPNADLTTAKISANMKAAVIEHLPMPAGAKSVDATYEFPFLAHATMEPVNAVADVKDDSCTVWAGTQTPDGAQGQVANMLKLAPEKVTINVTLLGGGFGRRLANDYIADAVSVSKAIKKPVQVIWTREDDMQHDHYRPAGYHSCRGAVAGGKVVAWSHQAIQATGGGGNKFDDPDIPYAIPGAKMMRGGARAGVPTGAWRSVEHTLQSVSNECFIDELAVAAGADPYEFRRSLIQDPRLRGVLELAAAKGDWGKPLPAGWGRGIACFEGYGSFAAHVVELSVEGGQIKLHRAVCAIDCGRAINPRGVEAIAQGGCSDGLATALRAAITIDKGGVVERSWPNYRWMTLDAMPVVEVHLVDSQEEPGGMGEPVYPSVPPAVANALFAATGKRVRKFPIKLNELV